MADDIASLGLKIDSSQVRQGTQALDQFGAAAKQVANAARDLERATANLGNTSRTASGGVRALTDAKKAVTSATNESRSSLTSWLGALSLMGRGVTGAISGIGSLIGAFFSLKGLLTGLAIGAVANQFVDMATTVGNLTAKLSTLHANSATVGQVFKELDAIATRTRSSLEGTVELYGRIGRSFADLGKSRADVLAFVEIVQKAIRVSGASAQEARFGVIQLGQALASGTLRGDEFRSLSENFPRLMQAIAEGMGKPRGALRQLAEDGKLTAEAIIEALKKSATGIEAEFNRTVPTVQDALTKLGNSFLLFTKNYEAQTGAFSRLAGVINNLADWLRDLKIPEWLTDLGSLTFEGAITGIKHVAAAIGLVVDAISGIFETKQIGGASTSWADIIAVMLGDAATEFGKWYDFVAGIVGQLWGVIKSVTMTVTVGFATFVTQTIPEWAEFGGRAVGAFIGAFEGLPQLLGGIFKEAMNLGIGGVEEGINVLRRKLGLSDITFDRLKGGFQEGLQGFSSTVAGRSLQYGTAARQGVVAVGGFVGGIIQSGQGAGFGDIPGVPSAASAVTEYLAGVRTRAADRTLLNRQAAAEAEEARARRGASTLLPDDPNAPLGTKRKLEDVTKEAGKAKKALQELKTEADFGDLIAAASRQGAAAVEEMELRMKAAQKAQQILGDTANTSSAAFKNLADKIYEGMKRIQNTQITKEWNLQTEQIEKQNELATLQLQLVGQRPEIIAKEIALLKVRQELEGKSASLSQEDIDRRIKAVQTQEELNQRLEEARKAQELWAEPFKQALSSIQSTFVSFFEGVFNGSIRNFRDLAASFKAIWFRLLAELAAVSIIRPIISPIVALGSGLGILPQSVAQQFGVAGGGATGGGGGLLQSLGLGNIGGGDLFGLGGFLSSAITPATAGSWASLPAGFFGPPAPIPGALGNLTWGGALAGIGSIGAGIFGLTQGNTIGGISGILGGGLGLLGAIAPSLSFLGPIGMGIGLIGGLLGSLFGKKKVKTPQEVTNIAFDPISGFSTSLAYSRNPGQIGGSTGTAATAFTDVFGNLLSGAGLSLGPGSQGGWILRSVGKNTGDQWITGLGTYGSFTPLPPGFQNGGSTSAVSGLGSADEAIGILAGMILRNAASGGTLQGASETTRFILANNALKSIDAIKEALDFSQVYDDLKRGSENITAAETAIRDLNKQFAALSSQAKEYGLDVGIIEQRRNEAINKMATDVNEDYRRRLLGMTPEGALQVTLEDLEKERVTALKNAEYLNSTVTGALVDINQLEEYYAKARVKIIEDANAQIMSSLQDFWRRITYGDLSATTPAGTLAGARASFDATLAQAQAGSATARGSLAIRGEELLQAQALATGHNAEYGALLAYIQSVIAPFLETNDNTGTPTSANSNDALTQAIAQIGILTAALQQSQAQVNELTAEMRLLVSRLGDAA